MMKILFSCALERCPYCHSTLRVYRKDRRVVRTVNGSFIAEHRILICPLEKKKFRSGYLDKIIQPGCTYANDITVDAAMKRFIHGRSSSEISSALGISEGHARKITNQALEIFSEIHELSVTKLKESMNSYILQIDGTTDSEFSMIVVVRDALSGFTLYVRRCQSESDASIQSVLVDVKNRFGVPSGITCDMRSGIISAAKSVFPHVPIRICLMHFLRDLGKDLMKDMHTDLGIMINRKGIKSGLKNMLKEMPQYDQDTLDEVSYGFSSHPEKVEIMSVRSVLENIMSTGSSGYGFPFSMRHLAFYVSCEEGMSKLSLLHIRMKDENARDRVSQIMKYLKLVVSDPDIMESARKLKDINSLIFQKIRKAFKIPDHGNLSVDRYDAKRDDPSVHERCSIIFGELEVYTHTSIEPHMLKCAKLAIERHSKREEMLFAQNSDGTIPRTNNNMEIFFRKMRRNIRKRAGNNSTGNILTQSGEKLALFQNIANEKYRDIVFGKSDMGSIFAEHRKPFKKDGMTKKRKMELVEKGTEMILDDSLSKDPYPRIFH